MPFWDPLLLLWQSHPNFGSTKVRPVDLNQSLFPRLDQSLAEEELNMPTLKLCVAQTDRIWLVLVASAWCAGLASIVFAATLQT